MLRLSVDGVRTFLSWLTAPGWLLPTLTSSPSVDKLLVAASDPLEDFLRIPLDFCGEDCWGLKHFRHRRLKSRRFLVRQTMLKTGKDHHPNNRHCDQPKYTPLHQTFFLTLHSLPEKADRVCERKASICLFLFLLFFFGCSSSTLPQWLACWLNVSQSTLKLEELPEKRSIFCHGGLSRGRGRMKVRQIGNVGNRVRFRRFIRHQAFNEGLQCPRLKYVACVLVRSVAKICFTLDRITSTGHPFENSYRMLREHIFPQKENDAKVCAAQKQERLLSVKAAWSRVPVTLSAQSPCWTLPNNFAICTFFLAKQNSATKQMLCSTDYLLGNVRAGFLTIGKPDTSGTSEAYRENSSRG